MSRIRANNITNGAGTGAPIFPHGAVINGIATITSDVSSFSNLSVNKVSLGTGTTLSGEDNNALKILTNGSERVTVSAGGNIGIGTDNPNHKLTLFQSGTGTFDAINFVTGNTNSTGYQMGVNSSGEVFHWNTTNSSINFATNNTERLRIGPEGQIGLGGENYGTAGQVIRSNGNSTGPTWTNVYQYYFYGQQDTQHNVSTSTDTALKNLGTNALNVGDASIAAWDESEGTLTIGASGAGIWWLAMGAGIDDIQSADYVQVVISKGGTDTATGTDISTKQRSWCAAANNIADAYVATICDLSADDVVRFYVRHQEGSTEPTEPNRCFAMGYKMM